MSAAPCRAGVSAYAGWQLLRESILGAWLPYDWSRLRGMLAKRIDHTRTALDPRRRAGSALLGWLKAMRKPSPSRPRTQGLARFSMTGRWCTGEEFRLCRPPLGIPGIPRMSSGYGATTMAGTVVVLPWAGGDLGPLLAEVAASSRVSRLIVVHNGSHRMHVPPSERWELVTAGAERNLADALVVGFEAAIVSQPDYVIKLDIDAEYPLARLLDMIDMVPATGSGAFCAYFRVWPKCTLADSLLHLVMGAIEGIVTTGRPFRQHSPGGYCIRGDVLERTLPKLRAVSTSAGVCWGLDLAVIALANAEAPMASVSTRGGPVLPTRRPLSKTVKQGHDAIRVLMSLTVMKWRVTRPRGN